MAGPFLTRDFELAAQLEAAFGTSPGALAAADFFKSRTKYPFNKVIARYDRDRDRDNAQRSVLTTQKGREHATFSIEGDIIPAGAGTPTKPDMDLFFEAHMGTARLCTAHTTLAAGSTTTVLNFTPGGVAASGVQVGDMIMVDVDATFGNEVRQIPAGGITGDAVTVDRALSAAPAAGRDVTVGVTFRLSQAQLKTLHLWGYLNGDNFRHKVGGAIPRVMALDIDASGETPVGTVNFSGDGKQVEPHSTARPTPATIGQALLPSKGKVWLGTTLLAPVKCSLSSDNGAELRQSDLSSLLPTGVKATGNNSRYKVEQMLHLLLTTGTVEGYYDNATSLTAYDVLVQLGITRGQTVAWRTPKWIPDVPVGEVADEVALEATGKCYALDTGDTEFTIAFL